MTAKDDGGKEAVGGGKGRLFTVGLVTSWYSSNIRVLLLNKYLLSNYGFKYPIFLTMCHMAACSVLSYAAIAWLRLVPMQLVRSRTQLAKIAALSLVFCASVVSGNISLRFLPVSFNQAVGATTPFFTAVFASSSPSSANPGPPTSPSSQSSPASSSLAGENQAFICLGSSCALEQLLQEH